MRSMEGGELRRRPDRPAEQSETSADIPAAHRTREPIDDTERWWAQREREPRVHLTLDNDGRIVDIHRRQPDSTGGQPRDQPSADAPAPYRAEIAEQLPDRDVSRVQKTDGILTDRAGDQIWDGPLRSGRGEPGSLVEAREMGLSDRWEVRSHVEAHAAAEMRLRGLTEAVLYVNNVPCKGPLSCDRLLPRMLPPNAKLTLFGPNGFTKVYSGLSEEDRR